MQEPFFSLACLRQAGRPACSRPIYRTRCCKFKPATPWGCQAVRPPMRCSFQARPSAAPIGRRRLAVRSMQQPAAEAAQVCPPPPPPLFPLLQHFLVQQHCQCRAACLPAAPCRNAPSCSGWGSPSTVRASPCLLEWPWCARSSGGTGVTMWHSPCLLAQLLPGINQTVSCTLGDVPFDSWLLPATKVLSPSRSCGIPLAERPAAGAAAPRCARHPVGGLGRSGGGRLPRLRV